MQFRVVYRRRVFDWVLIVALTGSWAALFAHGVADGLRTGRGLAQASPVVQRIHCDTLAPIGEPERARSAGRHPLVHERGTGKYT